MSRGGRPALSFAQRVLLVVRAIPPGRVATYGDVATRAGHPGAARAVGQVMRVCADRSVPCHRVVAADGRLGGYGGREHIKRYLLEMEGVPVRSGRVRDFLEWRWSPSKRASTASRGRT